jgi:hypothetical protein
MQRIVLLGLALLFAMFGPAMFCEIPGWLNDRLKPPASEAAPSSSSTKRGAGDQVAAASNQTLPTTPQLEGLPLVDLAEVFRFDVTPAWIMHRWSRVSSGLGNLGLQGYRVPLVTGTREDDLAGSLTYYFNPKQQIQQITFNGTTGDARRLVQLATTRYRFGRRVVNDPGQFVYEIPEPRGPAKSILQIRPASILSVNQPRQRFTVALVIDRPEEP